LYILIRSIGGTRYGAASEIVLSPRKTAKQ
jgi:hypothetical protein